MAFFESAGGAAAISAVGGLLGRQSGGSRRRQARRNQQAILQQMRVGNQLDLDNQKSMFNYRMQQGTEMGLTPVELFGSPASGAGGGTTGSGATLGNNASQQQMQNNQLQQQQALQDQQIAANTFTALAQTKMQTDAQKDVAETQAGATTGAADIHASVQAVANSIRQGELDLSTRVFEESTLVMIGMAQEKHPQEVKKLINEAATSLPEWQRAQTLLGMGVDNSINTMLQKRFGIDITDSSQMKNLSTEKFRNILSVFIAADSSLYKQLAGFFAAQGEDQFNLDPVLGSDYDINKNDASTLGNVIRGRSKKGGPAAIRQ